MEEGCTYAKDGMASSPFLYNAMQIKIEMGITSAQGARQVGHDPKQKVVVHLGGIDIDRKIFGELEREFES
jgi:hypothetical protein